MHDNNWRKTEVEVLKKTSIGAHYVELKRRLLISVSAWIAGMILSFYFAEDVFAFLTRPLLEIFASDDSGYKHKLIYTHLTEGLMTYFKLAIFCGIIIAHPIILSQFYFFLAPGLYKREKKALIPYMIAAPLLFFIGAAVVYYMVIPAAWRFFLSFERINYENMPPIVLEAKISEYLDLMIEMVIGFGVAFQLPVAISLLARVGFVTSKALIRLRKHAVVAIFIAAAILTPPDVLSQIILALPLLLLYEVSIIICKIMEKKKTNA